MDDKPTPSSLGDIDATVPTSNPESIAPLSVRSDADHVPHSHIGVHHAHSEALIHGHSATDIVTSMQTIQPSALTVEDAEEIPVGSVHLGPSEFAVTLPMDSRVKDYYERVIADASPMLKDILPGSARFTQMASSKVTESICLSCDRAFKADTVR